MIWSSSRYCRKIAYQRKTTSLYHIAIQVCYLYSYFFIRMTNTSLYTYILLVLHPLLFTLIYRRKTTSLYHIAIQVCYRSIYYFKYYPVYTHSSYFTSPHTHPFLPTPSFIQPPLPSPHRPTTHLPSPHLISYPSVYFL